MTDEWHLSCAQVKTTEDGLSSLIFTSEGDMRQALNNLQSTHSGFGIITTENVFKVCDQPHPIVVQTMLKACEKGDVVGALEKLEGLWREGYAAVDIVTTVFRVTKAFDQLVVDRCLVRMKSGSRYTDRFVSPWSVRSSLDWTSSPNSSSSRCVYCPSSRLSTLLLLSFLPFSP